MKHTLLEILILATTHKMKLQNDNTGNRKLYNYCTTH